MPGVIRVIIRIIRVISVKTCHRLFLDVIWVIRIAGLYGAISPAIAMPERVIRVVLFLRPGRVIGRRLEVVRKYQVYEGY